ncbi:MAG: TonB-dependent receptor plug domain-containing protein [Flavisolibacter sp.]
MKPIALCLVTVFVTFNSFAQEKVSELDPVTITTSINPEKASQTGRNLTVIKGERFANLPVHSVDELLRYVPGIEVQSRGPMGAQSDIVIRGGTFQQVLVVIDGLRLNDPNSGHFAGYFPIAPSEIDRIEVLKGAASAIYGSEAVGGVVHIITKTFAARSNDAVQKPHMNAIAQLTGGEYHFWNANLGGYYDDGKTSVAAGFLSNNTPGQQQRGTRGFVHNYTTSLSFAHHFGPHWTAKLRTAYDDRNFSAQNFYTTFVSDTAEEHVRTSWNQIAVEYRAERDKVSLGVGYKDLHDQYKYNSGLTPNKNDSKLVQALLTDEHRFTEKTSLTSGVQFIDKKIVSNDRGNHTIKQAAVFSALNQSLGNFLIVSPAIRVDYSEGYGWQFDPQVNLSYRRQKWQLRGSAGRTIRDADFTERYNNYNKAFVSSGSIGNPALKPEHSFSYEAGADFFVSSDLKISGTFFQRDQKAVIDYVPTPYSDMPRKDNLSPTGTYALTKNISTVDITGFETEAQYSRQLQNGQQVWATLGVTWLDSKSSSATPSFYISSHAKLLTTASLVYSYDRFSASINGLYKKRNPQSSSATIAKISGDYFVLNAKLEAFIIKKKFSVFVEADNAFDENYADLLGSQMPGRWLMGGIKISLSK